MFSFSALISRFGHGGKPLTSMNQQWRQFLQLCMVTIVCALCACSTNKLKKEEPLKPVTPPAATSLSAIIANAPSSDQVPGIETPPTPREFRAVWISTVANIDWPSRRDLSSDKQKAEIIAILDQAVQLRLNAIVLQVRPAADAIYPSAIEPWSEFLTGEQGRPPFPYYDPLQFWIEQAHARGLELHAWFNPYRARTAVSKSNAAKNHISKTMPEVVKQYGDLSWMDPGEPGAMQQTVAVITDVLRRYDIDGIHIDDYFYPYPVKGANGNELEFPDDVSWQKYLISGGTLNRADWRRSNVNHLVEAINQVVHQGKSWVKFGISPFGIGRLDRMPTGITGFSQYDKLYADVELWLANGWLDYLSPQLYWPINQAPQAFKVLNSYWQSQNLQQRHIWPGLYTSRIDNSDHSWSADEILNQVDALREQGGDGHVHFSLIALKQNRKNISQRLAADRYTSQALVPASPWLENTNIAPPQLTFSEDKKSLTVKLADPENTRWLAIWKRTDQQWLFSVQSATKLTIDVNAGAPASVRQISVMAISRSGQESIKASAAI
ncbi:glycoside hydrolase family 10 protein [Undibacterium sp. RuRC25W]|uniref:glycoside hydrolase family 10 protein n=1 Tax=Undibacterium sp. RuRC25W TaxID=3413047 RepID=UPI003BF0AC9D